jgi:hypothetical protein
LLEVAGEAGGEQPFPLVARLEIVGGVLRPVEAERLAQLGVGAGQLNLVDFLLLAQHGEPDRAVQLEQAHDLVGNAGGGLHLVQLGAQAACLGARLRPEQVVDHRFELGEAGRQEVDQLAGRQIGRGAAEQVRDVQLETRRGLVEQSEADLFGNLGPVQLVP